MKKQSAILSGTRNQGLGTRQRARPQSALARQACRGLTAIRNLQSAIGRRAFTLTELLVVMLTMALLLAIALPGVIGLFTSSADVQGRKVFSAMLGAARGVAVESQSYAGLHVQIGADGRCWTAIIMYDGDPASHTLGKFIPAAGYAPRLMPGNMAFGEITSTYVSGGSYTAAVDGDIGGFTTFNVVFGPNGSLTELVPDPGGSLAPPVIATEVKIFGGDGATPKQKVWDDLGAAALNERGVRAVTIFNYKTFNAVSSQSAWLEENGQFLCINPYTGKLLPTK